MTTKKHFLILISLSLTLILTDRFFSLDLPESLTQEVFKPVLLPLNSLGFKIARRVDFLLSLPGIYDQNQKLKRQLLEMAYLKSQNQQLEQQNQALRNQLTIQGASDQKLLPARVLGRVNAGADVFLLIDAGTNQGLAKGEVAVLGKSLVGRVESVTGSLARVRPVFSSKSQVPVLVGQDQAKGQLRGELNTKVKLTKVLQQAKLKKGDLITTSGVQGVFPPGLLVGKVSKVFTQDWQIYQQAKVEMFWDPNKLETVFVKL